MSTARSDSDGEPNVDDASTSGVGGGGGDANAAESLPGPPAVARQPPPFPPFLSKCYDMIDDPSTDSTVSWSVEGNSFVIWDPHTFSRDLLPKFYKHNNLSSFVRQLNTYGFHKVDPDRWEFANEGFVRGQKHLLKTITRKKNTQGTAQPIPMQVKNLSAKACVEVGKFGLEKEIERLKRDKNVLMQELVKLRHHQQSTDSQLHGVRDRLQEMEQHQQQMLSFLAMAVQSPGFLAQLVQQNGDTRWRNEANKKRRIPALEQGADVESSPDGQIVTYQPFASENWRPQLASAPDNGATLEQASFSDGINYMNKFVDNMFSAVDSDIQTEEEFIMDIPPDLERFLASSLPENAENADQHNIDVSDLGMYFDLELPEVEMETSENLVFPSEEMEVEH